MLVLKRRYEEKVYLMLPDGGQIELVIMETKNGSTRIGITAPDDIEIIRGELRDGKKKKNYS